MGPVTRNNTGERSDGTSNPSKPNKSIMKNQPPKNTKATIKNAALKSNQQLPNIPTPKRNPSKSTPGLENNSYAILHDHDDMDEEIIVQPPTKKEIKPSSIIIKSKNVSFIQETIKSVVTNGKFSIKILSIGLKLEVTSIQDFELAKTALQNEGLEYFFYHTQLTKPKKIVLKGLQSLPLSEVKRLLNEHKVNPDEVRPLTMKNLDRCNYILYFKPGTKLDNLKQIKCINYLKVSWEHFRSRRQNNVVQCRNCQLFGHNSVNCSMKPKCLVCANDHTTETCPHRIPRDQLKQQERNGPVDKSCIKCSNCASAGLQSNHTANWSGCPKRLEYYQIQQRIADRNPTNKKSKQLNWHRSDFPLLPSTTNQTKSIPVQSETNQTESNPAQPDAIQNNDLFSASELQEIWVELFSKLRICQSKEEQLMTLGNMVIKYLYGSR